MRIALGVAIAFLAVYMVALRPKSASAPVPPAPTPAGNVATGKPAVTGAGKAVEAAKGAVAATEAQQTKEGQDAGVVPSTGDDTATRSAPGSKAAPRPAAPAVPAADVAGLPRPVAKAIQAHEVLALLFTNGVSADDRAVQRSLAAAEHRIGEHKVLFRSVPLGTISRYGRITRGADVEQSPTVVVVDRQLRATNLVGYVDPLTVEQAVVDALRASGSAFGVSFLRGLNAHTSAVAHDLNALPVPGNGRQYVRYLHAANERFASFVRGVRALPAHGEWAAVKRGTVHDLLAMRSVRTGLARSLGKHPGDAKLHRLVGAARTRDARAEHRFAVRAQRHHLISATIPALP
jgi:hypothetical protein